MDLGIVREDSIHNKQSSLDYVRLGEYKYAAFVQRDLWGQSEIIETEFFRLRFAMIKSHWDLNFLELANLNGVEINNIRVWCETFTQVFRLVYLGQYAGILPIFCSALTPTDRFIWFEPTFLKGETQRIVLAWNKSLPRVRKKWVCSKICG